jgi:hypothetical protein
MSEGITPEALRRLLAAAEARRDRDLSELQAALTEQNRLDLEIARLTGLPAREMAASGPALPPPQMALRLEWVGAALASTRRRRQALEAQLPRLRREAARSLGRHRVLEELDRRGAAEAERARAVRAEREAPPAAAKPL